MWIITNLMLMYETYSPANLGLFWNLTLPSESQNSPLVILISDWIYGLLPYCGPGSRYDIWNREKKFQDELCSFLNNSGIATISLETSNKDQYLPAEKELVAISSELEITSALNHAIEETGCSNKKMVIFGHGFGCHLLCKLALSGIKPAGYILAAGLYSDTESILYEKYLPVSTKEKINSISDISVLDPETDLILKNLGKIMYFARKGKEKKRLNKGDLDLELFFPKELFSYDTSPAILYSYLNAPTLIIHGSGDLDIPVSNAFFLEQKLKQHILSVSRIVLFDCDHWFREMTALSEDRMKERLNGECIHHNTDSRFHKHTLIFIRDILNIGKGRIKSNIKVSESDKMISSLE